MGFLVDVDSGGSWLDVRFTDVSLPCKNATVIGGGIAKGMSVTSSKHKA